MVVSVAVLGCGPGGMSFCHAVETLRQAAKENAQVLSVTCFEKSSTPGGVWKAANPSAAAREGGGGDVVNMYAALWTNGSSHGTEYFDYTYDEHFRRPVTVYMPRNDVLGYMIGRVTQKCPNFFQKYVQFDTAATHVAFDHEKKRFDITLKCQKTDKVTLRHFDKCVWACGENSKQHVPRAIHRLFRGFSGRVIHSADSEHLLEDVQGKRILLIGGGYSAEDLALQAIKLGVEKVYVSTRAGNVSYVSQQTFPFDKVETLEFQVPASVDGDSIHFKWTKWTWASGYVTTGDERSTTLRNIDTVIFCTGYEVNLDMLDKSLCKGYPKWGMKYDLEVPGTWTMPDNLYSDKTGNVKPGQVLHNIGYTHPEFYRGLLVSNPNMMYVTPYDSYYPLLATDTSAWMLASFLTGATKFQPKRRCERK